MTADPQDQPTTETEEDVLPTNGRVSTPAAVAVEQTPSPTTADANYDDILWQHLKTLPAFRALLRAVEARFYHQVELPEPLLDLGCGDGNFAELTFNGRQLGVGLDPWWNPLRKSKKAGIYELPLQGLGHQMPFPSNHFNSAISNSVLEHIPDIQPVLTETGRVLKPGGRFVMTMPNHNFTKLLGGAQFLERLGQDGLAERYRTFFNFISRHAHTESIEWWGEKLAIAGFKIERWQYYFSEQALHALELGHVQGVPSAVLHALTGQWVLAPNRVSLAPTDSWVRPFFEEEAPENGTYLLIIAQKVADHPIQLLIPEAQPFTQEELALGEATMRAESEPIDTAEYELAEPDPFTEAVATEAAASTATQTERDEAENRPARPLGPLGIGLFLLAIITPAMLGQSILNATPEAPTQAVFWYGVSLLMMFLFGWTQKQSTGVRLPTIKWPRWSELTNSAGFIVGGLVLSWIASRLTSTAGEEQTNFALWLWIAAIGATLYGFWPLAERWPIRLNRSVWLTAGGLLLAALFVRYTNITEHPFVLSGTEATIGLEAILVNDGRIGNPFGTSWLTNPTLPLYLIGVPIRFLGRTALAVRFWSPLIGALTVAAVYLIGRKGWNQYVGLAAALLLAGSHWHIHYSRLGLTNVWDPLLTLLALGLLAIAWQEKGRILWLLSGLFLGLNAYLYTSSHLLPIMIAVFVVGQFIWNREALWANGRNLLSALTSAFIIALPQILFYNRNSTIFTDRLNQYGIFQTGWLQNEATQTGQTTFQILQEQFTQALLAYNAVGDVSPYYRTEQPLLGYWFSVALVFGVAIALYQWREVKHQLLLIWFGVTVIFGGALLLESPASHRLLISAPAVALLAGIALSKLVAAVELAIGRYMAQQEEPAESVAEQEMADEADDVAETDDEQEELETAVSTPSSSTSSNNNLRPHFYKLIALTLLVIAMIVPDMLYYFVDYRTNTNFGDPNTETAHVIGEYLQEELDGSEKVYFLGAPVMYTGFPTITYLGDEFSENINLFNVDPLPADNPAALLPPIDSPTVFIIIPARFTDLGTLISTYPNGTQREFAGFYSNPLFITYEVEP